MNGHEISLVLTKKIDWPMNGRERRLEINRIEFELFPWFDLLQSVFRTTRAAKALRYISNPTSLMRSREDSTSAAFMSNLGRQFQPAQYSAFVQTFLLDAQMVWGCLLMCRNHECYSYTVRTMLNSTEDKKSHSPFLFFLPCRVSLAFNHRLLPCVHLSLLKSQKH